MGIIIIGPNGEEEVNTYKKRDNQPEIRRNDYTPQQIPQLDIIQIPTREDKKIPPYMPLINPEEPEKPIIDEDFKIPLKRKIPRC